MIRLHDFGVLALLIALWLPAITAAETSQPQSLAHAFAAAWNAHDAKAFEKLFAADAAWVTAPGTRLTGRDAIRDFLAHEHETWARTTTMTPSNILVRLQSTDVAVVLFDWEIARRGSADAPGRGNNLFVASRQAGQWIIVAGQVASRRAGASQ